MPLSEQKKNKMKRAKRVAEVNARSLNGKGYFMDATVEHHVRGYLDTGNPLHLDFIPDYRKFRQS